MKNKLLVTGLLIACALSACTSPIKIISPLSESEKQTLNCKQIGKEADQLNRQIARFKYSNDYNFGLDVNHEHLNQALKAAELRLKEIKELSVQRFCTYG